MGIRIPAILALFLAIAAAPACSSQGESTVCTPSASVPCSCADGRFGLARCRDDGMALESCRCSAPDSGSHDAVTVSDPGHDPDSGAGSDPGTGAPCLPDCEGRVCGGDGCGGTCGGTCPEGMACKADGSGCEAFCPGTVCGDGTCCAQACCGGACCDADARCVGGSCCRPECFGRQCGGDGCGGSCGTCPAGCACTTAGTCDCCVDECPQDGLRQCYAQGWHQCGNYDADPCLEWSEPTACGLDGCDSSTGSCLGCDAACAGRQCGWAGQCWCGACAQCATCDDGACTVAPRVSAACHGGNLEWRDACGNWEGDVKQSCACGCTGDACDTAGCTTGALRCNGAALERCAGGCAWDAVETCTCGCQDGACRDAACTDGAVRCSTAGNVERCDGCTWTLDQACDSGCTAGECNGGPAATIAFVEPTGSSCENPVTFRVETTGAVARVSYAADGWPLGSSTNAAGGFPVTYSFSQLGQRHVVATAQDAGGTTLATAATDVTVTQAPVTGANQLGVWVWNIEGTGYSHAGLAAKLAAMGVKRVYLKVADGSSIWSEASDSSIPPVYHGAGLEVWGWSYNYTSKVTAQAEALYTAAGSGYDGYVLDIESEFDGSTTALRSILEAFVAARTDARNDGLIGPTWPIHVTTWGNPGDHDMHVEIIDQYADAHMPQTYLEVWGSSYMANAAATVQQGTCEYRSLGAYKPVHHILSTEYGKITAAQLNAGIGASGPQTSIWRVPGDGTPDSIWDDWAGVNWDRSSFDAPDCP